jgi:hypothetical protein
MSDTTNASGITRVAIEPFKDNKDMGRILLRRSGETVAAGMSQVSVVELGLTSVSGIVLSIET